MCQRRPTIGVHKVDTVAVTNNPPATQFLNIPRAPSCAPTTLGLAGELRRRARGKGRYAGDVGWRNRVSFLQETSKTTRGSPEEAHCMRLAFQWPAETVIEKTRHTRQVRYCLWAHIQYRTVSSGAS
jgi:hypothetical protein